ncbi:MAG: nitroreductase family protein [bacterium]|nr:nitroreductase family protein [bacterium]
MSEIIRALDALQKEEGWLSSSSLTALATRLRLPLHRLESISTFYTRFKREKPEGVEVEVCRDLSCRLAGAESASAALRGRAVAGGFEVQEVSCLGRCDRAPAAAIGDRVLDASDLEGVSRAAGEGPRGAVVRPIRGWAAADPYSSQGGDRTDFRILRSVLAGTREAPIERLEAAGLRGMGGAAFPTARKWSLVAAEPAMPKHVVCNADESEPGTFKDREILHDLPHLVIEGMAIAAYCVGAERGTVFIRHEYGAERERLEAALCSARRLGALGERIFGTDFSFEVDLFVSPGGYILGEETALLECLEGRRGEPRNKPPFPGTAGLYGRPTLINNVETLVHAASIVHHGSDWWHGLGLEGYSGHKFISVSGDVAAPGVSLLPVGTCFSDVLAAHGGMRDGAKVGALAPGGASSHFLGPEALDLALDFDALQAAGSMLGSGAAVFVAEDRDLLDIALSITRFFRNESCGKCVPCRVGSEKAVSIIEKGGLPDEALLRSLAETMQQTSICGLGQVALAPLLSILSRFPDRIRRAGLD